MSARLCSAAIILAVTAACSDRSEGRRFSIGAPPKPDEPPVMVNSELPFRYPPTLYARRVQGNVMLRLFVDRDGRVVTDSTRVEQSSTYPALDSAAVQGSQDLLFVPAKLNGEPMPVAVLFPVYFRHPEAAPLAGDTVLAQRSDTPRTRPTGGKNSPPSTARPR